MQDREARLSRGDLPTGLPSAGPQLAGAAHARRARARAALGGRKVRIGVLLRLV